MSITQGEKILYSDIQATYNNLNKATSGSGSSKRGGRQAFGYSNVTVPSLQNATLQPNSISSLSTFISEMAANKFLTNIAKGVTTPTAAQSVLPSFLATLKSQVDQINNTCPYDGAFFASNFAAFGGDYSGDFGFFTSNRSGFNGSNFTNNNSGFNGAHFTNNNSGFNGSNFTSNRSGFNGSNFTSNRSGFNGSNFTSNRSGFCGTFESLSSTWAFYDQ